MGGAMPPTTSEQTQNMDNAKDLTLAPTIKEHDMGKKSKEFMCTNCHWAGNVGDMNFDGATYSCPNCCAEFNITDPTQGPWEEVFVGPEDPDDLDDEDEWPFLGGFW